MRTSRKSDFRKLKKTLVASTYPGQRPQCPSLSRHVLLTDIIVSIIVDAFSLTLSLAVIVNVFTVIVNFITYVYSMSLFISLSLALSCLLSLLKPLSHALIVYYIHTNTNNSQRYLFCLL